MALPTLDATFASSADLPRRQMLAKWLVEELGETQAPSSVLVSGAGSSAVNGTYTYRGENIGKPYYNLAGEPDNVDQSTVVWIGDRWQILDVFQTETYESLEDVEFPWLVETWLVAGIGPNPVPTVIEVPAPSPISNYWTLPEKYLWAKIAVAAGAPKTEADYISLPKNYAWSDIYNSVAGSSGNHTDWSENVALGHIAAAYRGDTGNPEALATYISWPWRYKVASIIGSLLTPLECANNVAGITINGESLYRIAENQYKGSVYSITIDGLDWLYYQNGVQDIFRILKVNDYPWQDEMGTKDCSLIAPNVVVSDAGTTEVNGTYLLNGSVLDKPSYSYGDYGIQYNGTYWVIRDLISEQDIYTDISEANTFFPWDATGWSTVGGTGSAPDPTLTPTNV